MKRSFTAHARTVTLVTFLSRVTGLARDAVLSRMFGAGLLMDAFFFAFMLPNLFRRLFGEGALSAAFLPVYAELYERDRQQARRVATLTIGRIVMLLGVITLLGEGVLFLLASRATDATLALWLMMIMLPYMPMVCLVAMLGAMLQVHGRFGPTAAAPIILNLAIVIAAVLGGTIIVGTDDGPIMHIALVAGSVLIAGSIQVGWSLLALRREAWWVHGRAERAQASGDFRRVLHQAGPMIVGLGVLQLNTFFDGLIASYPATIGPTIFGWEYPLDLGAMATVSYAQRLYQFPLGVFGIAIATAIFPLLARLKDDQDGFRDTLQRGLRLVLFIGLPASVGLMLVREPLTAVILQGGDFTDEDTRRVGRVLLGYAPAVWAYSMTHVLTRAFYARSDSKTPLTIALKVVILNVILNCTLIWTPLREAGLAWSTAICATTQAALLLLAIRRHAATPVDAIVIRSWLKSIMLTVMMASFVGAAVWMSATMEISSWSHSLAQLTVLVTIGAVIALLSALALRMPELRWALGRD